MTPPTSRALGTGAFLVAGALALTACGGSGFDEPAESAGSGLTSSDDSLTILIGSSGDAETDAVTEAVAAWSEDSGVDAEVQVASDLPQQLSQGFAAGTPPDLFYLAPEAIAGYAGNGSLQAYGDELTNRDDFYPSLVENFTVDDTFYCAPKDFSTLALAINTDDWAAAGLTDADFPKTWDQLKTVARKLTTGGRTGLVFNDTRDRIGAFLVQAGGWSLDADQKKATADTPQNLQALTYVRDLLASGAAKYPKQIGAGDSSEAFGQHKASMSVDGNWMVGGMRKDYPGVKYRVVALPAGPAGPGTLSFTQCWGIAAKTKFQEQAKQLVDSFMQPQQQLAFAEAFGVIPSRQSVRTQYEQRFPAQGAFVAGAEYAHGPVTLIKMDPVLTDFDAQLQQLPGADPKQILQKLQQNTTAALGQ